MRNVKKYLIALNKSLSTVKMWCVPYCLYHALGCLHICITALPQPEKPTYPVITFREPPEENSTPLVKGRSVRYGVLKC